MPPFPRRLSVSLAFPSPGIHTCHLQERTSLVAVSSPGLLCDYISFCFCSWCEELFTFPQEVLLLKWENTLWPSASRKTVPSLEKSQMLLWWGVVCSLGPCNTPTQGAHTRSIAVPLGWVYSCPLQLHVVSAHRTSASKDYYFSSFYINYFLFRSLCLPQTMPDLR